MNFGFRHVRLVGLVTIVVVIMLLTVSFRLSTLSQLFSGGGQHYSAEFTDAAGISVGDPVRIAGIAVGKVDNIRVVAGHAVVDLTVRHAPRLGDATDAALSLDTLLGQHSLVLTPHGSGTLKDRATIPLARTTTPFGVTDALIGAANTLEPINTQQLTKALTTVAGAIDPAASEVRTAATGLSGLAKVVGDRDAQVQELFGQTAAISRTLALRSKDLTELIGNSGLILQTLDQRRAVIRALLNDTSSLAGTINAIIADNKGQITPALTHLERVLKVLVDNQADLDESLRLLAPYLRYFTNVVGNGRWFDGTIAGLVPLDLRGGLPSPPALPGGSTP